jgi:hypothetical protein
MSSPISDRRAIAAALRASSQALSALADALDTEQQDGTDLIDQHTAPIGARRFIREARRMQAAGEPGVFRDGRRWLMSPAALEKALERLSERGKAPSPAQSGSNVRRELEAELRLIRGSDR